MLSKGTSSFAALNKTGGQNRGQRGFLSRCDPGKRRENGQSEFSLQATIHSGPLSSTACQGFSRLLVLITGPQWARPPTSRSSQMMSSSKAASSRRALILLSLSAMMFVSNAMAGITRPSESIEGATRPGGVSGFTGSDGTDGISRPGGISAAPGDGTDGVGRPGGVSGASLAGACAGSGGTAQDESTSWAWLRSFFVGCGS